MWEIKVVELNSSVLGIEKDIQPYLKDGWEPFHVEKYGCYDDTDYQIWLKRKKTTNTPIAAMTGEERALATELWMEENEDD